MPPVAPTLPMAWRVLGPLVAAKLALQALANAYGLHVDEWYYIVGGRRLQWGYVDHPPLTPCSCV